MRLDYQLSIDECSVGDEGIELVLQDNRWELVMGRRVKCSDWKQTPQIEKGILGFRDWR